MTLFEDFYVSGNCHDESSCTTPAESKWTVVNKLAWDELGTSLNKLLLAILSAEQCIQ